MARRLRMEQAGGFYHVINRGNYRRDLFESTGAAEAFLRTLFEAAKRFQWTVYAYILMRNHFHLAVETREPTLGEGMHWLQTTMAVRFNRLRAEKGHLFQGRYKAMPIEDMAALARVVDYIHLNPVRARILEPGLLTGYRWSSLRVLLKGPRPEGLVAEAWLQARGAWKDDEAGRAAYAETLVELAKQEETWEKAGVVGLGSGWAIGTSGWRRALARDHAQKALAVGMDAAERKEFRAAAWESALEEQLRLLGRTDADVHTRPGKQSWKLDAAEAVRREVGASIAWLAKRLELGAPGTVRSYLHVHRSKK